MSTEKVKLSKDGSSIDFVQTDNIPTSLKKFRQSPEIEGFYRFVFENDLQKETFEILDRILSLRKTKKIQAKLDARNAQKEQKAAEKFAAKALLKAAAKPVVPAKVAAPVKAAAPAKPAVPKKIEVKKAAPVKAAVKAKPSAKAKVKAAPAPKAKAAPKAAAKAKPKAKAKGKK